jgi:hypothetical protein
VDRIEKAVKLVRGGGVGGVEGRRPKSNCKPRTAWGKKQKQLLIRQLLYLLRVILGCVAVADVMIILAPNRVE